MAEPRPSSSPTRGRILAVLTRAKAASGTAARMRRQASTIIGMWAVTSWRRLPGKMPTRHSPNRSSTSRTTRSAGGLRPISSKSGWPTYVAGTPQLR